MGFSCNRFRFSFITQQDCKTGPEPNLSFVHKFKISYIKCECLCNSVVESLLSMPEATGSNPGQDFFFS